jgi:hypothetical protein
MDIDNIRRDDTWVRKHFDSGTLDGEQSYPMSVDRAAHHEAAIAIWVVPFSIN